MTEGQPREVDEKEFLSLEDLASREGRAICYSYDGGEHWYYGVIPKQFGLRRQGDEIIQEEVIQEHINWHTNESEQGLDFYEEKEKEGSPFDSRRQIFESDFSNSDFRIRATTDEEISDKVFSFGTIPLKEGEPLIKPPIGEQIKHLEALTITFYSNAEAFRIGGNKPTVVFGRDIISE